MRSRRRTKRRGLDPSPFPNRLKRLRRAQGLTQRQVARCLGHLEVAHYGEIERGKCFPHVEILTRLLSLFNASMWDAYPEQMVEATQALTSVSTRRTG